MNASNIVKLTLDRNTLPALTHKERAELDAVAAMRDERIDYTDAAYLPDAEWVKVAELLDLKHQITLRLDADVLDFFRHTGRHYQTRINAVLRSYVDAQKAHG